MSETKTRSQYGESSEYGVCRITKLDVTHQLCESKELSKADQVVQWNHVMISE